MTSPTFRLGFEHFEQHVTHCYASLGKAPPTALDASPSVRVRLRQAQFGWTKRHLTTQLTSKRHCKWWSQDQS